MKYLFALSLSLFCFSQSASAAIMLRFDNEDLSITATGGVVTKSLDIFLIHDGNGVNEFSEYELQFSPSSEALSLVSGSVLNSAFTFDLGHAVAGNPPGPYLLSGASLSTNNTVPTTESLLATIEYSVDTGIFVSGTIDLNATMLSAFRNGTEDITDQFSVSSASIQVTAVPEPSCVTVLLIGIAAQIYRLQPTFRKQNRKPQ